MIFRAVADDLLARWNTTLGNARYLFIQNSAKHAFCIVLILHNFQRQWPVFTSVQACNPFTCSRTLHSYPAFWILRNQWIEKAYNFSGKQLSNHSMNPKKEIFSGKPDTTEHCYKIICLFYNFTFYSNFYPILLLQLDNFFSNWMFAFHSMLIKLLITPVSFFNTGTHGSIFVIFCPMPCMSPLVSPSQVNFSTFLYSVGQYSSSFILLPFASFMKGITSVHCCIRGNQMFHIL